MVWPVPAFSMSRPGRRSYTSTGRPWRRSASAAVRPPMPAPAMSMGLRSMAVLSVVLVRGAAFGGSVRRRQEARRDHPFDVAAHDRLVDLGEGRAGAEEPFGGRAVEHRFGHTRRVV